MCSDINYSSIFINMFKRFSNSWQLFKASLEVLKQDRELLWFPVLSSLAALVVVASFMVPLAFWGSSVPEMQQGEEMPFGFYLGMFAFYIVLYFVIFFFNTALVGAAMMRLDGLDPTVSDGLRIARERVGAIFGYAVIAATVGLLLQAIEGRVGQIGKIVVGLLGASRQLRSASQITAYGLSGGLSNSRIACNRLRTVRAVIPWSKADSSCVKPQAA